MLQPCRLLELQEGGRLKKLPPGRLEWHWASCKEQQGHLLAAKKLSNERQKQIGKDRNGLGIAGMPVERHRPRVRRCPAGRHRVASMPHSSTRQG